MLRKFNLLRKKKFLATSSETLKMMKTLEIWVDESINRHLLSSQQPVTKNAKIY